VPNSHYFNGRSAAIYRLGAAYAVAVAVAASVLLQLVKATLLGGMPPNSRVIASAPPLAPVLEQAFDAAVHVSFLPAPNRRLRHPSLALD